VWAASKCPLQLIFETRRYRIVVRNSGNSINCADQSSVIAQKERRFVAAVVPIRRQGNELTRGQVLSGRHRVGRRVSSTERGKARTRGGSVGRQLVAKAIAIAIAIVSSRAKSQEEVLQHIKSVHHCLFSSSFRADCGSLSAQLWALLCSSRVRSCRLIISLLFPKKLMGYVTISDGVLLSS